MEYHCMTKGFELTDRLKEEVEIRLVRLERRLRNFQPSVFHASVALERPVRGGQYRARLALNVLKRVLVARQPGPTAEVAVDRATVEVERQVERYKARLRQDYVYERKRTDLSVEERRILERELLKDRALVDQAITGDQKAVQDLTERELPALTRYIYGLLARRGLGTSAIEAQVPLVIEKVLQAGFENLPRKPGKMAVQGWLAQHARQVLKRLDAQ